MLCRGKPEVAKRSTHLDLKPDPAAGAPVLINDHIEVLRHRALHAAVLDVDAAQSHWRHLVEGQRLQYACMLTVLHITGSRKPCCTCH